MREEQKNESKRGRENEKENEKEKEDVGAQNQDLAHDHVHGPSLAQEVGVEIDEGGDMDPSRSNNPLTVIMEPDFLHTMCIRTR